MGLNMRTAQEIFRNPGDLTLLSVHDPSLGFGFKLLRSRSNKLLLELEPVFKTEDEMRAEVKRIFYKILNLMTGDIKYGGKAASRHLESGIRRPDRSKFVSRLSVKGIFDEPRRKRRA